MPQRDPAARAAYMREWRRRRAVIAAESAPHGTRDGYDNWMCRCDPCSEAHTAAINAGDGANRSAKYRSGYMHAAVNTGREWTGAEMAIATERDSSGRYVRSASRVAEMLGRTRGAVLNMRHACKHDPRYIQVIEPRR